ncbi:MAG: hypothetical protein RMI94_07225 [Bryobacterales bacterium]|nr:hypothetical protein [Bryobacteraceae bacterium]MDW8130324.1 hypothetical protein [Bryobacterales bacterium]
MGGATQLFSTPAPGASAEPIAPAGTPFGPSEFTRVVQAAPVETAEAAAPASPIHPPTRPAASHSYLPLLIISGSMLVIALMLVIYFVLRR